MFLLLGSVLYAKGIKLTDSSLFTIGKGISIMQNSESVSDEPWTAWETWEK